MPQLVTKERKYAISLLNAVQPYKTNVATRSRNIIYTSSVKDALHIIWRASNQICSKRLVPFIPEMIEVLERNGHLILSQDIKNKLCNISTSSVDRLLKQDKDIIRGKAISTTKSGQLLKNQIKVRTFADWDDVIPGFLEGDLVAHCGGNPGGSFINTLTLTDIDSTWTECMPLLYRSAENVIKSLSVVMKILPFDILGIAEIIFIIVNTYISVIKITYAQDIKIISNEITIVGFEHNYFLQPLSFLHDQF